jgi:hypothetical protein
MDFHHTDTSVLETLRKEIMGFERVWVFLHTNNLNKKGVKLEIKNEFDGELTDIKQKEIHLFVKSFCKQNKISYKSLIR